MIDTAFKGDYEKVVVRANGSTVIAVETANDFVQEVAAVLATKEKKDTEKEKKDTDKTEKKTAIIVTKNKTVPDASTAAQAIA